METNDRKVPEVLTGWKEIGAYLGVEKTTAQRWEKKHGLPVRHLPGPRGRVVADSAELARWKNGSPLQEVSNEDPGNNDEASAVGRRRWWRVTTACGMVLAVGILLSLYCLHWQVGPPADYRTQGRDLTIMDSSERTAWHYTFPHRLLDPYPAEKIWFEDLNGDGRLETLFAYYPADRSQNPGALYCFSSKGELDWKFIPGRKISSAAEDFSQVYDSNYVDLIQKSRGGGPWIVLSSNNTWSYPDQVVVLSTQGKVLGEYWHSGHLLHGAHADLDGDGVPEILLGGVDNGYDQATLVVLDPRHVSGASSEPKGSPDQLRGFPPGTEKDVVFFPRTCIDRKFQEYNRVADVRLSANRIFVNVAEGMNETGAPYVIYELDRGLHVISAEPSDLFLSRHRRLEVRGMLHHSFSPAEAQALRQITVIRNNVPDTSSPAAYGE